jgi:hypothetical protein
VILCEHERDHDIFILDIVDSGSYIVVDLYRDSLDIVSNDRPDVSSDTNTVYSR